MKSILISLFVSLLFFCTISLVSAEENITFTTTGATFEPKINVTGTPIVLWTFSDGSTSDSLSPSVSFGMAATRNQTLKVIPWSAVTQINIGYDGADGGSTPNTTILALPSQHVTVVQGLENVASSLQIWTSSYNPITSINLTNFTELNTVECFKCSNLTSITLKNTPKLSRLCVEDCKLTELDLSGSPALVDIRASQKGTNTLSVFWGDIGSNLWHICIHDNILPIEIPYNQFTKVDELYIPNTGQTGVFQPVSTHLTDVKANDNQFTGANFSGKFKVGEYGSLVIRNNSLISLDISNNIDLQYIDARNNLLSQSETDNILKIMDSYNSHNGYLLLTENAMPSNVGNASKNNLTARGWTVTTGSNSDKQKTGNEVPSNTGNVIENVTTTPSDNVTKNATTEETTPTETTTAAGNTTKSNDNKSPGFAVLPAIVGLIAVVYLVRKNN